MQSNDADRYRRRVSICKGRQFRDHMRPFSVSKGLKIAYERPAKSVDRKAKSPKRPSVGLLFVQNVE